jgi:hypothetical protein
MVLLKTFMALYVKAHVKLCSRAVGLSCDTIMSQAVTQLPSINIKKFRWAPLLAWHVAHQAEQSIGETEGFGYPIQLNREEPSPSKWGGTSCVVQDRKVVICKHDYIGDSSKGFVGCSWLESIRG